jgi:MoaA/NifB/PqqE/SkfB family radical SAM enzyme
MTLSFELFYRFCINYLRLKYSKNPLVKPLLLAYFVTYRCNLSCLYCDYSHVPQPVNNAELSTDEAIELLKIIRAGVPSIAFSGGEPLMREDIDRLVYQSKISGFKPISLFTNGLLLPQHEILLQNIDFLQISLDTLDEEKQDQFFNNGRNGLARELKEILSFYAAHQHRFHIKININSVLTPNNLKDIIDLYKFAKKIGVRLTVCPQLLENGQILSSLHQNTAYQSIINQLIQFKQKNETIMDTLDFLIHIRDFSSYSCYPYLTPRVYPDGNLAGPCPVINQNQYNLLEIGSWEKAFHTMIRDFGVTYSCKHGCFLPCYLETSTLLIHPWQSLKELFRLAKPVYKAQYEKNILGDTLLAKSALTNNKIEEKF